MAAPNNAGGPNRWVLVAGLLGVFLVVRFLSTEGDTAPEEPTYLSEQPADAPAVGDAAQASPIDEASVRRAAIHASRAVGALGSEGAMAYSELCYEALRHEFSARRRDRCYAFDLFAARLLEQTGEAIPYRFSQSVIRSRWTDEGDAMTASSAQSETLRGALEALASAMSVAPEAPPSVVPAVDTYDLESEAGPAAEPAYPEADTIEENPEGNESSYGAAAPA